MNVGENCTRKYQTIMPSIERNGEKMPDWLPVFNDEMADFWSGEMLWNTTLTSYTTFRVGGAAEALVFPRGVKELSQLIQGLRKINVPWHVIGRGSNIVVSDKGVKGVVIVFGHNFSSRQIVEESADSVQVKVEAGHSLSGLVNWSVEKGLSGLEFAVGIPGTIGGAIVMNAGAWGGEIRDVVASVTMIDKKGNSITRKRDEIDFAYRSWGEADSMIAVEGVFELKKSDPTLVKRRCQDFHESRKNMQPQNKPSGGSFFKNPPGGKSAGQLIDESGLKGLRAGGAEVSSVHANFIVNDGSATAADIIKLMHIIQQRVEEASGISLQPEVRFLGWE